MFLKTVLRPVLELIEIPARFGDADHRHVEMAAFHHRLQRWKDFLVSQIAGCPEENQSVGMGSAHGVVFTPRGFFHVAAELKAHRREQLVGVVRLAARGESIETARCSTPAPAPLVDGGLDGPSAFARVRNAAGKLRELRDLRPRQSRSDPAAMKRSRCRAATLRRCLAG